MSDAPETPSDQPQPSARLRLLQAQAVQIGERLSELNVACNWGDQVNSQQLRTFAYGRGLLEALITQGLLTRDAAECAILQVVVEDMERLLQHAEEQAAKASHPQIALPMPPRVAPARPDGILDLTARLNGHRH